MARPLETILADLRKAAVAEARTYGPARKADAESLRARLEHERYTRPVKGLDKTSREITESVLAQHAREMESRATPLYSAWQKAKDNLILLQVELEANLAENNTLSMPNKKLQDQLAVVQKEAIDEKGLMKEVNEAYETHSTAQQKYQKASTAEPQEDPSVIAGLKAQMTATAAALELAGNKLQTVRDRLAEKQMALTQMLLREELVKAKMLRQQREDAAKVELQAAALRQNPATQPPPPPPLSPAIDEPVAVRDAIPVPESIPVTHAPVTKDPSFLDKIWDEYIKFCKTGGALNDEGKRIGAKRVEASLKSRDTSQPLLAFQNDEQASRCFSNIAKLAPDKPFITKKIGVDGNPTGDFIFYDGKGTAADATAVHGKVTPATIQRFTDNWAAIIAAGKTEDIYKALKNEGGRFTEEALDKEVNKLIDIAVPSAERTASIAATQRFRLSNKDLTAARPPIPTHGSIQSHDPALGQLPDGVRPPGAEAPKPRGPG